MQWLMMYAQYISCQSINTLRFLVCVRLSVCDGCGRGRNGFAGRVQNHHVRFSFHRSFHKMAIIFLEIVKAAAGLGHSALQATRRMPLWALACHRTSDGQEHKIILRAGPERERIFHLRVTACRAGQPLSR